MRGSKKGEQSRQLNGKWSNSATRENNFAVTVPGTSFAQSRQTNFEQELQLNPSCFLPQ
jgi:hypothetical protein